MFKRVEKRRRRRLEQEELGLDEDMMHDTDSEESDSESSSDSRSSTGYTGGRGDSDNENSVDLEGGDVAKEFVMSVQEALREPIYLESLHSNVPIKACIICPGKLLKRDKMVELHQISKACRFLLPLRDLRLTLGG
jgi:hypothetical protein